MGPGPCGPITRRGVLTGALGLGVATLNPYLVSAQGNEAAFAQWVRTFRVRALARGISDSTFSSVMTGLQPDNTALEQQRSQPEFREPLWKYLNRRVSAWRVEFGKKKIQEHAALFDRIESRYGVDRLTLMGIWGNESAFGELVNDPRYMRPVIPSLAALAYGEPRRRAYWEQELLNALTIVERGWSTPKEMNGSWAGAMGHTQWMPEVWLRIGVDFNRDGRISPFGSPDDALAGSARYLLERGRYQRGESWGGEVQLPPKLARTQGEGSQLTMAQWKDLGVKSQDTQLLAPDAMKARLWVPVLDGPAFLLGRNFYAVRSYNPSSSYAMSVTYLGDRVGGKPAFSRMFPGGERALTLAEMQEVQSRLTRLKYDTYHTDGRVGRETIAAVADFQRKQGIERPDGYPGLDVLARLRRVTG
jgi:membrane-bound lytic murein transglycosylase B